MDIAKYGKIVVTTCEECFNDAIQHTWDTRQPWWLYRFESGDFNITSCLEYDLLRQEFRRPQPCFVVESTYDYGRDELLVLCQKHLRVIVEQLSQPAL